MRWQIHGTDATTGQEIELALDEQEASRAVKAAIERHIIVDRVTSARGGSAWRILSGTLVVAFAGVAAVLLAQNLIIRHNLQQALDEQTQLALTVSHAEQTVNQIRTGGNLAAPAATQVNKLAEELASSRSRISVTEQQLTAARQKVMAMEESAARVPELERQLVAIHEQLADAQRQLDQSKQLADQFRTQTTLQARRLDELDHLKPSDEAVAKIAQLDATNKDLAGQIEKLKSELLLAAARSTIPDTAAPLDPPPTATATPWALGMSYDAARDFTLLHIDRNSVATAAADGNLLSTYGMQGSNALRIQFVHDKTKERVYSGTLTVSLSTDAPKDKLDENRKAVADFLQTFAPGLKAGTDVLAAAAQLAAQDDTHRMVILGPDAKLTMWNNKGAYTFRVESPRGDAE